MTSLPRMRLCNIKIRGEEISQLKLPIFTDVVCLESLSGDINQMLPLITTDKLWICSTNLSSIDTEALVQCLDANVSQLELYNSTVDISALSKYDGRGKCKHTYNVLVEQL